MSRVRRLGAVAFIAALALGSSAIPADPIAAGDPLFRDVTRRSGIDFESGFLDVEGFAFVGLMARSSAAAGDYDGDGDIDLFIVRGDIGPNLLYRNDGRLRFTEVPPAWPTPAGRISTTGTPGPRSPTWMATATSTCSSAGCTAIRRCCSATTATAPSTT